MTMEMLEAIGAEVILGSIFVMLGLGCLFMLNGILNIIGSYKMFTKAGEAGWKAIIPFLNDYVRYDRFWDKKFFWAYLIATIAAPALGMAEGGFMALIGTLMSLAIVVLIIKLRIETARRFGCGMGMAILLMILPGLGSMILGFGSAQYQEKILKETF